MSELGKYHETESLGNNQYRTTIGVKPIAFLQSTGYKRINSNWQEAGDGRFVVDNAPFRVLTYPTGGRRVYPIRDDFDRWIEIGRPHTKVVTQWQAMDHGALACKDNALSGSRINTGLGIVHGGHFVSWELELKNRPLLGVWKPADNLLAFPYELRGLDFKGNVLYADGKPVMRMRSPIVSDLDNEDDTRSVTWSHQTIDGQRCFLYTLPDLTGMSKPLVDPTLELQPDGAAGVDTYVKSSAPDTSYETDVEFRADAGFYIGLIKFTGISVIPNGSIVTSATLSFWTLYGTLGSSIMNGHSILSANDGWIEAATWNYADGAGASDRWAGDTGNNGGDDAGCSVSGTDYNAAVIGSWTDPGTANTEMQSALTVSAGQDWVNGNNYGMAGIDGGGTPRFKSSDHATAAQRPKLVVVYTLGGGGARLLNLTPFNHKRRVF